MFASTLHFHEIPDIFSSLILQVTIDRFRSWRLAKKPILDVGVEYDRTKLTTSGMLKAKATLKYNGQVPTYSEADRVDRGGEEVIIRRE